MDLSGFLLQNEAAVDAQLKALKIGGSWQYYYEIHSGEVYDLTAFTDQCSVYGVRPGMTMEQADQILTSQGFEYFDRYLQEKGLKEQFKNIGSGMYYPEDDYYEPQWSSHVLESDADVAESVTGDWEYTDYDDNGTPVPDEDGNWTIYTYLTEYTNGTDVIYLYEPVLNGDSPIVQQNEAVFEARRAAAEANGQSYYEELTDRSGLVLYAGVINLKYDLLFALQEAAG